MSSPQRALAASAPRPLRPARPWRWPLLAVVGAAVVAMPVVAVALNLLAPSLEVWRHLASTVLPVYVANSLGLTVGVAVGVVLGGVGSAWLVTMCRFPGARWLEWALVLPMAMPAYVVAYAYTGLLDFAGPVQSGLREAFGWHTARDYWFPQVRSLGAAICVMTFVFYPYVYVLARAAFLEQSVCVLEAGRTLGRGPWRAFLHIALPLARPAIAAGTALALMETLNDFGTVQYFAVDTFTTGIYRTWIGLGQPAVAAQLAAVLMLFVLAVLLVERWTRRGARFHHTTGRYRTLPRIELRGATRLGAQAFCAVPVLVGFVVPVAMLVWLTAWTGSVARLAADFGRLAANSLALAAGSAALAVAVALALAYARRIARSRPVDGALFLAGLGYAIPGSVIAVGTLLPLVALDRAVAALARVLFGIEVGLLLTGTAAALLYAYLVRFLAVSLGGVEAGLAKVSPSMDSAARMLGAGPVATLRRVHAPILRGSLLSAALLVFVDVLKELPATLILRPFGFETLATQAYAFASDERLPDAAGPSLAIALVALVPTILLARTIARSRPGGPA